MLNVVRNRQRGFSLLEVIIGITVIVMVIVGTIGVYVTTLSTSRTLLQRLIASELAQEGLEIVRNIRDTNWKQGLEWDQQGASEQNLWETPLAAGEYIVYRLPQASLVQPFIRSSMNADLSARLLKVKQSLPWKIFPFQNDIDAKLYILENSGMRSYVHLTGLPGFSHDVTESFYTRKIVLTPLQVDVDSVENATDIQKFRVTSIVEYRDRSAVKEVRLSTELTDWK